MFITSKRCSLGSSLSCNFIKWDWVKCSIHILRGPWAVPPGYHMLKEKLYFVCWHSIKILFRTDKGRLLACLCVLIKRFHSCLKFLIEHQNFIKIGGYSEDRPPMTSWVNSYPFIDLIHTLRFESSHTLLLRVWIGSKRVWIKSRRSTLYIQ